MAKTTPAAALIVLVCTTSSAFAYLAMPNEPMAHKVAVADCVVLGKITAIEPKPVAGQVWRYSALPRSDFTIVEMEVEEMLFGPKDAKKVRFGMRDAKVYKLAVGQIGCVCGVKVGMNDFYIVPLECFQPSTRATFAQDLALARRAGRLLAKLDDGLTSKDVDERVSAAHLLILRSMFAPFRYGETGKAEPIDPQQSKRALLALAEADADKHGRELREALTWLQLAGKFGAPPAQGLPLDQADPQYPAAARQWLRDNAERYRIHRLVKAK